MTWTLLTLWFELCLLPVKLSRINWILFTVVVDVLFLGFWMMRRTVIKLSIHFFLQLLNIVLFFLNNGLIKSLFGLNFSRYNLKLFVLALQTVLLLLFPTWLIFFILFRLLQLQLIKLKLLFLKFSLALFLLFLLLQNSKSPHRFFLLNPQLFDLLFQLSTLLQASSMTLFLLFYLFQERSRQLTSFANFILLPLQLQLQFVNSLLIPTHLFSKRLLSSLPLILITILANL